MYELEKVKGSHLQESLPARTSRTDLGLLKSIDVPLNFNWPTPLKKSDIDNASH